MESKSAKIGINPSANTSLILSISSTVLVVNVPIGVLSKCERFNERLYKLYPKIFYNVLPQPRRIYEK
jgi:hypothetical protein